MRKFTLSIMSLLFIISFSSVLFSAIEDPEREQFFEALLNHQTDKVEHLIKKGIEVDIVSKSAPYFGHSALNVASQLGDNQIVQLLLSLGADVNFPGPAGYTSLMLASMYKQAHIVKILLDHHANWQLVTISGDTALDLAIIFDNRDAISYLQGLSYSEELLKNAFFNAALLGNVFYVENYSRVSDVDCRDDQRNTALIIAAERNHLDFVKYLLSRGANVNAQGAQGHSALHKAAMKGYKDLTMLLVKNHASINIKDDQESTPLMDAANEGQYSTVELLIQHQASVDDQDHFYKETALMKAVDNNDERMVDILLNAGANPNLEDREGNSVLTFAVEENNAAILKLLLEKKPALEIKGHCYLCNGRTALQTASLYGYTKLIELLLEAGANQDSTDQKGDTALFYATRYGDLDSAKMLIEHQASINITGYLGHTPLTHAIFDDNSEMVHLLIENGADIELRGQYGNTPLMVAVKMASLPIVQYLIEKGADLSKLNNEQQTVFDLALQGRNDHVIGFLTKYQKNIK